MEQEQNKRVEYFEDYIDEDDLPELDLDQSLGVPHTRFTEMRLF